MKRTIWTAVGLAVVLILTGCATTPNYPGLTPEQERVQDSIYVLEKLMDIPEATIPRDILDEATGIAIIPQLVKAGYVVGGEYGEGVFLERRGGLWSYPVFIQMGGGSIGLQAGVQATDLVLVFTNQQGVDKVRNGTLTIGGDMSAAAGPVGRRTSAETNVTMDAAIYSYSRSKGAFAGVSVDGAGISIDQDANAAYYRRPVSVAEIVRRNVSPPSTAVRLRNKVDSLAP